MDTDIKNILELGALAPSGGNSQPWDFRIPAPNIIEVVAHPERDHPILNFHNRGTWLAHGALFENILIAAAGLGYHARYEAFPDKKEPNLTARIILEKSNIHRGPLFDAIAKRATNRKLYKKKSLTKEQKNALIQSVSDISGVEVRLTENEEDMKRLGSAASVSEVIMLENKTLHELFVKEIVWTAAEEKKKCSGLFLKTMELKPPQEFVLQRLVRHWSVMRILKRLGFAKLIARDNAVVYSSAAIMGCIIIDETEEGFLTAGRALERLWLQVTSMGLSLQLMSGINFMHQRLKDGNFPELSLEEASTVEEAYGVMASIFKTEKLIVLLFRIGSGDPPSAYSSKKPPTIIS